MTAIAHVITGLRPALLLLAALLVSIAAPAAVSTEHARLPASQGQRCGGITGLRCAAGLWCEITAGQCGRADGGGRCVRPSEICTREYRPVCGCNGKSYGNDCTRRAARVALRHKGTCAGGDGGG